MLQDLNSNRVIFLDFDGVLHPINALMGDELKLPVVSMIEPYGLFRWTPLLESILSDHEDVVVVVHSSWAALLHRDELQECLGPLAPRLGGICTQRPRWDGVVSFVESVQPISWVVLDDDSSHYPAPLPSEVIICDEILGITDPVAATALRGWLERGSRD